MAQINSISTASLHTCHSANKTRSSCPERPREPTKTSFDGIKLDNPHELFCMLLTQSRTPESHQKSRRFGTQFPVKHFEKVCPFPQIRGQKTEEEKICHTLTLERVFGTIAIDYHREDQAFRGSGRAHWDIMILNEIPFRSTLSYLEP